MVNYLIIIIEIKVLQVVKTKCANYKRKKFKDKLRLFLPQLV
jgi:hypothetical protein